MNRDLGLNLARVTEATALAAGKWMRKGDKNAADGAAVDAMRRMFDTMDIDGTVVIGEGETDEAPILYIGEGIGRANQRNQVDIAVDPLDGTTSTAGGMLNTIAVVAVAPKGCLLNAPDCYMNRITCGPKAKGAIRLDVGTRESLRSVTKALGKDISDLTISVLKRERHEQLVREIHVEGTRVKFIDDGDIVTATVSCFEDSGVDLTMGIGGALEGVIAAAALKCLGGDFQGRLMPSDETQLARCKELKSDLDKTYHIGDLIKGDEALFSATGISNGELLRGVSYYANNTANTDTLVSRLPSGAIRKISSMHKLDQKPDYT